MVDINDQLDNKRKKEKKKTINYTIITHSQCTKQTPSATKHTFTSSSPNKDDFRSHANENY